MSDSLIPSIADGMGAVAAASVLRNLGLEVELVPCLSDNYCPLIHQPSSKATIVVDTPDPAVIIDALKRRGWEATHVLNTHHHDDHAGGNLALKHAFPSLKIFGPKEHVYNYPGPFPPQGTYTEVIPGLDEEVCDGDEFTIGDLKVRVLEVGGHTDGHIAYFLPQVPLVFSGDSLFTLGCGRVFTGNFSKMLASMKKLRDLPDETIVYCAHEYTASNAKFALQVEPDNVALLERNAQIHILRSQGLPTVPTLLAHEKATNPFLRWDEPSVQHAVGVHDPVAVFTAVRRWKDTGKQGSKL